MGALQISTRHLRLWEYIGPSRCKCCDGKSVSQKLQPAGGRGQPLWPHASHSVSKAYTTQTYISSGSV